MQKKQWRSRFTDREEPLKKWRLTFGRERYPTVPIIVRKTEEPGDETRD